MSDSSDDSSDDSLDNSDVINDLNLAAQTDLQDPNPEPTSSKSTKSISTAIPGANVTSKTTHQTANVNASNHTINIVHETIRRPGDAITTASTSKNNVRNTTKGRLI